MPSLPPRSEPEAAAGGGGSFRLPWGPATAASSFKGRFFPLIYQQQVMVGAGQWPANPPYPAHPQHIDIDLQLVLCWSHCNLAALRKDLTTAVGVFSSFFSFQPQPKMNESSVFLLSPHSDPFTISPHHSLPNGSLTDAKIHCQEQQKPCPPTPILGCSGKWKMLEPGRDAARCTLCSSFLFQESHISTLLSTKVNLCRFVCRQSGCVFFKHSRTIR